MLILVIVFTIYPFGYAIYNSLFRILLVLPITPFVGLKNYADVVSSTLFPRSPGQHPAVRGHHRPRHAAHRAGGGAGCC